MWSRLGNEKTHQFPEIADALEEWAARLEAPVILDGEIVALDVNGEPTGFQRLQGRIHVAEASVRKRGTAPFPGSGPEKGAVPLFPVPSVAFIAFDILREGRTDLRRRPRLERRAILERVCSLATGGPFSRPHPILRLSEMARGITGEVLHVDGGFHSQGAPNQAALVEAARSAR